MSINLNVAVQQALGEMSYLVNKKQASIIRNHLPSLDLELKQAKRIFRLLLHNVISNCPGGSTPKIEISSMRDLNDAKWIIEIQSNVTRLDEQMLNEATSEINKVGGLLYNRPKHTGSTLLFTLPYKKTTL